MLRSSSRLSEQLLENQQIYFPVSLLCLFKVLSSTLCVQYFVVFMFWCCSILENHHSMGCINIMTCPLLEVLWLSSTYFYNGGQWQTGLSVVDWFMCAIQVNLSNWREIALEWNVSAMFVSKKEGEKQGLVLFCLCAGGKLWKLLEESRRCVGIKIWCIHRDWWSLIDMRRMISISQFGESIGIPRSLVGGEVIDGSTSWSGT